MEQAEIGHVVMHPFRWRIWVYREKCATKWKATIKSWRFWKIPLLYYFGIYYLWDFYPDCFPGNRASTGMDRGNRALSDDCSCVFYNVAGDVWEKASVGWNSAYFFKKRMAEDFTWYCLQFILSAVFWRISCIWNHLSSEACPPSAEIANGYD